MVCTLLLVFLCFNFYECTNYTQKGNRSFILVLQGVALPHVSKSTPRNGGSQAGREKEGGGGYV